MCGRMFMWIIGFVFEKTQLQCVKCSYLQLCTIAICITVLVTESVFKPWRPIILNYLKMDHNYVSLQGNPPTLQNIFSGRHFLLSGWIRTTQHFCPLFWVKFSLSSAEIGRCRGVSSAAVSHSEMTWRHGGFFRYVMFWSCIPSSDWWHN